MWKKIIYIAFVVIIGIVVYFMGYTSNQYNHILELTTEAVTEKKYSDVAKIFGGCFDTKSIVADENSDKLDLVIYPGTSQTEVSYTKDEKTETFLEYEKAYYFYVFDIKFGYSTVTSGESTNSNDLAVKFSNGTSEYIYHLVVDSEINKDYYVEKPTTLQEAVLNNSRDASETAKDWKFITVTFTETMLDAIVAELGSDITNITIIDNSNEVVYSTNITMDFSDPFFTYTEELIGAYNTYLDDYTAANGDDDKEKAAVEKFEAFYDPWHDDFEKDAATTGYTFRYEDKYLSPSKLVWQTIGNVAIFLVVAVMFYFIFFHFSAIRSLFSRQGNKDYNSKTSKPSKPLKKVPSTNQYKNKKDILYIPKDGISNSVVEKPAVEEVVEEPVVEEVVSEPAVEEVAEEPVVEEVVEEPVVEEVVEEPVVEEVVEEPVVEEVVSEPVVEEVTEKPAAKKAPAKKTTSTTKKPSSSAKKTTSTTKKNTSSAKKTTSTTKKTPTAAKKTIDKTETVVEESNKNE